VLGQQTTGVTDVDHITSMAKTEAGLKGLFIREMIIKYRSTLVILPPVNPPNSLICQNCKNEFIPTLKPLLNPLICQPPSARTFSIALRT